MLNTKRKERKEEKINVIPILDAVFIFIFFLLMSAQFLEIYELSSDAPAVSLIDPNDKDKKPPLNLILEIKSNKMVIKTGLAEKLYITIENQNEKYDYDKLNKTLTTLKLKNIDEGTIIFRPLKKVKYQEIIVLMDTVRKVYPDDEPIVGKSKDGQLIETRKLFETIMFEEGA